MRKAKGLNLISILLIVSLAVMSLTAVFPYVYSYFTATAREQGELKFGSIGLNMLDKDGKLLSSETFEENYLYGIDPGSSLDLNGIKIKNSGVNDAYALVNVDVEISNGTTKLNYNKWYNVDGMEVNVNSFAANVAEATLIKKEESKISYIKWKFPGDVLDNTYQNATAKVSVGAYGMQTLMPKEKEFYVGSDALFASYFICKNATEIQADNPGKNLFNINNPLMLLKHQYDSGYAHKIENGVIYSGGVTGSSSGQIIAVPTNGEKVFTFSGDANTSNYKAQYYGFYNYDTDTMIAESPVSLGVFTVNKTITLTEDYNYVGVAFFATEQYAAEISNFQIELGSTATEYEPYKGIIHNEITSTPLMALEHVEDSYASGAITRNIAKYEITGYEAWYAGGTYYQWRAGLGANTTNRAKAQSNVYANGDATKDKVFWIDSTGVGLRIKDSSFATLADLTDYLKAQYENGNPVTIWYELATPTTEKVVGSKNLYDGDQFIHYKTGASDNNTTVDARYEITDESTVKLLRDKSFVVSAKYKNYEDDTTLCNATDEGFIIAIQYTHKTKGEHVEYIQSFSTAGKEDKLMYAWVNNTRLLAHYTESELNDITAISIHFRSYANNGAMIHYDMKNIQIELGSSPTDYEVHDQTVYAYAKGVPLRQVGNVKDEYSSSTGQITRNVVKYEITSTSMNIALWSNSVTENSAGFYIYNFDIFGRQGSPTFKDSLIACSHLTPVDSVYTTKRDDLLGCCWLEANANPPYIAVKVSQLTTNELNNWLDTEAANGNPVTIWLARMTPITESI